jgi:DNA polymerase-3 subunit epsilon
MTRLDHCLDFMTRTFRRLLTHARAFVAIDFETATRAPTSACAVGIVRVDGEVIVAREYHLIRPPTREFTFTALHGIGWADVADAAPFSAIWSALRPLLRGVSFIAAHYATFDRLVLRRGCAAAGIPEPHLPFVCTWLLARRLWMLRPAKLGDVCAHLGLPLHHHHAASDAEACARILIAARRALA